MKLIKLIPSLFYLITSPVFCQSNLPLCQGSDVIGWTHCIGTFTLPGGSKYVGQWKDGKRSGQGTFTNPSGEQYVGEYADDKYNGQGTYTFANGSMYVGDWKDGIRNGRGILTFVSGNKYVGDWKDGKRSGQGVLTFANGDQHAGGYADDKYNGQGTYTFANGSKYVGDWKDGIRSGEGTFTNVNGNKYVGEWKDGKRNGRGVLTFASGLVEEGIWADGKFIAYQKPGLQSALANENDRKKLEEDKQKPVIQAQIPSLSLGVPTSSFTGKRIALVIGNAAYKLHPLDNPKNDADDMSKALKATGFEVIDIRDASLPQMRSAVRQFGDKLLTKDVGLVYYSGHGVEVKGRNYFIPVNADIKRSDEVADQGLDVGLILDKMETAKKGVNILIVDACRDDPFGRSSRSGSRGLATMDAPQGTIIAFATSPGRVAADGAGRNSPYTKNLVKVMQVPNIPIEQVFKQVRRAVQEETKNQQTPWENTSLSGDFYFNLKK